MVNLKDIKNNVDVIICLILYHVGLFALLVQKDVIAYALALGISFSNEIVEA